MKVRLWCSVVENSDGSLGKFVDLACRYLGTNSVGLDVVVPYSCIEKRECGKDGCDGCLVGKRIEGRFP